VIRAALLAFFALALGTAQAQDAPSQFWTRQQIAAQSLNAAVRAADVAQTCYHLGNGWREAWEPSQSCAGVSLWTLAGVPGSIGTAYLLHRHHHDRLARWTPYIFAVSSTAAIAYSYSHHSQNCTAVPSSTHATYNCR
jgi:hypothetical protein